MFRKRGLLYVTGALIVAVPFAFWVIAGIPATAHDTVVAPVQRSVAGADGEQLLVELAKRDPMALVRQGQEWYEKHVHDYRCVLIKQERLEGELSAVQEIEVRFRERPLAVYMIWRANADGARRALYMTGNDYRDKQGRQLTRIEPNGRVARLFTTDIYLPLDDPRVRKASRRTIDEAGFYSTFELLEAYNRAAEERGVLDIRYGGTGMVDGRRTFVIVRDLPYEGEGGAYPDARMVLHLDQEWLLPVAVYTYADHDEQTLLGSYVFTQVDINPGFTDQDFEF
jgi:hypothetical protein